MVSYFFEISDLYYPIIFLELLPWHSMITTQTSQTQVFDFQAPSVSCFGGCEVFRCFPQKLRGHCEKCNKRSSEVDLNFFFLMRQIQTSWIVCFLLGTVAIFWTQATSLMLMHIADIAGAWFRTGRQRQESIRTFPVASSSALLHGRWSLRPRWRGGAWIAWRTARCQDVDLVLNMVKAFWLNIS